MEEVSRSGNILESLFEPTDSDCQEANSQRVEKMLHRMAALQFILYITMKGGGVRRVT